MYTHTHTHTQAESQLTEQLFSLYHNEQQITALVEEVKSKQKELDRLVRGSHGHSSLNWLTSCRHKGLILSSVDSFCSNDIANCTNNMLYLNLKGVRQVCV